jgi:H+-translocating NAD(P) transhydrogenase subunit alpha
MMIVAVPRETFSGERRVALVPAGVAALTKKSLHCKIEAGAGEAAGFDDDAYRTAGAEIIADRSDLLSMADVLLQVRTLGDNPQQPPSDLDALQAGAVVIGAADPLGNPAAVREYAERKLTLFALELLPRITRAQSMDILSSMATIAGYEAVLMAAHELPRIFPLLMTAAGTLKPARVLVIGAGVAGLQAIATARRLGAIVMAYDVRPAAREQIESLGASAVQLDLATDDAEDQAGYAKALTAEQEERQRAQLADVVADCDVVITTAAIPGRPSPRLITAAAVERMQRGSVVVDLAAQRGGNCELTLADQIVESRGVRIFGPTNLPSAAPLDASQMYSTNVVNFVSLITVDGKLAIDTSDQIVRDTMVTRDGEITSERLKQLLEVDL